MTDSALTDAELANRLGVALGRLSRRIRPSHGDLSAGHFSTLATLERLGPQRLGDLARIERVSAPTMTRLVSTLAKRGYACRHRDEADARSVAVEITALGLAEVEEVRAERAATVRELFDSVDARDRAALCAALPAIEALAAAAVDSPGTTAMRGAGASV